MRIFINDTPLRVEPYEEISSVLQRYSLSVPNTLPEFFLLEEEKLENGGKYTVIDIRDELNQLDIHAVVNVSNTLSEKYSMTKKDIIVLWFVLKDKPSEHEQNIKIVEDSMYFPRVEIERLVRDYNENISSKIEEVAKKVEKFTHVTKKFKGLTPVDFGTFHLEEITFVYSIATDFDLIYIFNSITVNSKIPFMHLRYRGTDFYKVYKHTLPQEEWATHEEDGLYFYISTPHPKKNIISTGVWLPDNTVKFEISTADSINFHEIVNVFFEQLKNVPHKITTSTQSGIKGKFTVETQLNKAVLTDMITNSEVFRYFLFLNEHLQNSGTYKSALTRKRFSLFYKLNQNYLPANSLSLILTPYVSTNTDYLDIRVMRALNVQQIESFKYIFGLLLALYIRDYDEVINIYKDILPASVKLFGKYTRKAKTKKIDEKSGKRLQTLKAQRPGVFRAGYATMCVQTRQPYIVSPEEAENIKDEYGEHKIMEFTDPSTNKKDIYACEPREKGEPELYVYPGLKNNTNRTTKKYKEEVPVVPCCFTEDQYTKPGSKLRKTLSSRKTSSLRVVETDISHILTVNKRAPEGRLGLIPYFLSFIVKKAGYNEVQKGKQSFLPVLRYGVLDAPDSFFHCLEKALSPGYSSMPEEGKKGIVLTTKRKLMDMDNYAYAKQELYDYSDESIRELLSNNNTYFDPAMWVSLAEKYYDVNIFLYKVDAQNPNGAIVIPRYSQAYLYRDIDETKKTVFIVMYELDGTLFNYPYQCELLIKYNPKDRKRRFEFFFENDTFVEKAIEVSYSSNIVSVVNTEKTRYYTPV